MIADTQCNYLTQKGALRWCVMLHTFKAALPRYISEHLCLKSEDLAKNKDGAVERMLLKVAYKNGHKCCTSNLYYATSKILINGALSEKLIKDHLPEIHSSINAQLTTHGTHFSTLNQHISDSLLKATQKKPKDHQTEENPISTYVTKLSAEYHRNITTTDQWANMIHLIKGTMPTSMPATVVALCMWNC